MVAVLQCLETLRAHFNFKIRGENVRNYSRKKWNLCEVECFEGFDRSQVDASYHGEHSDKFGEVRRNSVVSGMVAVKMGRNLEICEQPIRKKNDI